MRVRQRRAEVLSLDEPSQIATLVFADDGEVREVSVPDEIAVAPGMFVKAMRSAERELALQAQRAYERTVADRQQKNGAGATAGRASSGSSKEQVAWQGR